MASIAYSGSLTPTPVDILRRQMYFPFVPPAEPMPTELHSNKPITLERRRIGNTIRRGNKWANVPKGHALVLTEGPDHLVVGTGVVKHVWTGPFDEVQATVLDRNHAGSQTYSSVLIAMRAAYGEDFAEDEIVVFLDYKRTT